jgi:thiamine biosynthesis protein ThiS
MQVTVNGESADLPDGLSVEDLLSRLQIEHRRLAVEINREILPKQEYTSRRITAGDVIEIVHFIGGG